jgi:hypothetical protein
MVRKGTGTSVKTPKSSSRAAGATTTRSGRIRRLDKASRTRAIHTCLRRVARATSTDSVGHAGATPSAKIKMQGGPLSGGHILPPRCKLGTSELQLAAGRARFGPASLRTGAPYRCRDLVRIGNDRCLFGRTVRHWHLGARHALDRRTQQIEAFLRDRRRDFRCNSAA